jgi:hypothetical protein
MIQISLFIWEFYSNGFAETAPIHAAIVFRSASRGKRADRSGQKMQCFSGPASDRCWIASGFAVTV